MNDVGSEGGGELVGRAIGETGGGAGGERDETGGGADLQCQGVDCLVFGIFVVWGEEVGGAAGGDFGEEALAKAGRKAVDIAGGLGEMPTLGGEVIEGVGTGGG